MLLLQEVVLKWIDNRAETYMTMCISNMRRTTNLPITVSIAVTESIEENSKHS
jgi:hypothetical protein